MPSPTRRELIALGAAARVPFPLGAQERFPLRPSMLIVPCAPGGMSDVELNRVT